MTPEQAVARHRDRTRPLVVEGVRTAVLEEGEGPPVVCVHGVPTSAYLYRKVVPAMAAHGLRGIAVDLPGLGLAERPGDFDYSWTGLGRWAAAAVDALDLDAFHLVVHDAGGPVGFEVAAAVGNRVRSLTILNAITDPAAFTQRPVMRPFGIPVIGRAWLAGISDALFVRLMRLQSQRPRDSVFERDRDVPAPFDVLEDFQPGLDNHAYRPPRSAYQTPAANPRIHVHDNGRFVITGLLLDRNSGGVHGGAWEIRDDLLVIGFDNLDRNHAVHVQQHAPQTTALTWERPDRRTDLYDLRLGWHDNGIDIAFSSNVTGYAATCVKLTDTP